MMMMMMMLGAKGQNQNVLSSHGYENEILINYDLFSKETQETLINTFAGIMMRLVSASKEGDSKV